MRSLNESMNPSCDRRDILKVAGGARLGNTVAWLGLVASVAATAVMVGAVPVYAQAEKNEPEGKASAERVNGKSMFEWMKDLKEKDPSIRERAIATLKVYRRNAREASREVIKAINDKDMSLRVNAIITLGFIGMDEKDRPEGVNALKGRLSDNQGIVRFQAARALGRLDKDAYDAVPQLIHAAHDQYCWEIRAAAVTALSSAGFPPGGGFDLNAFHAMLELTRDPCVEVRVQTVLSLIRFGTPIKPADYNMLRNAYNALTADKHKRVMIWARVGLMRILPPEGKETQKTIDKELKHIAPLLRDPDLETRTNAARAIAFIGKQAKSQVQDLIGALGDNEAQMIQWTCVALASIGPDASDAYNALKRLEQHPDPAVRDSVRTALEKIGAKPK